jgi:hypothetical protein
MIELRPQLTFSPEGVLQIVTGLDEHYPSDRIEPEIDAKIVQHKLGQAEAIGEGEGVEISEEDGIATISVDIEKRFDFRRDSDYSSDDVDVFLSQLSDVLPFHPIDGIDRVFGLEYLGPNGASGVIYNHFQRFLNSNAITEDTLRHAAIAMTLPFGSDITRRVRQGLKTFNFEDTLGADGFSSSVHVVPDRFGLFKREQTEEQYSEVTGSVPWRWLNISTLGSCACWGAAGDDRERGVTVEEPSLRLYEMSPHNVDVARQSLSLMLGVGTLAYYAAQYKGNEDIYANATWNESRVFKLPL